MLAVPHDVWQIVCTSCKRTEFNRLSIYVRLMLMIGTLFAQQKAY